MESDTAIVAKTSRIVYICHASLIYVHVAINSMQFFAINKPLICHIIRS